MFATVIRSVLIFLVVGIVLAGQRHFGLAVVGKKPLRRFNSIISPRAGLVPVGPRSQPDGEEEITSATGGACQCRAMIRKWSFSDAYND